jgi:hypothetical protein
MQPRPEFIEALVQAALLGMSVVEGATGDEVFSACLSLAQRTLIAVVAKNPDFAPQCQMAVNQLYLACIPEPTNKKDLQ